MFHRHREKWGLGGAALMAVLILSVVGNAADSDSPYPRIARIVAGGLPRTHLTHEDLSDSKAAIALDNYLTAMDPDRSYFFASDVEQFRQEVNDLDDQLRTGHTEFATRGFNLLKERAEERSIYVERLLEKGFDPTVPEFYTWKRKDAAWPADAAERDELWRKKIKNEYLAQVVARTLNAEDPREPEEPADEIEAMEAADLAKTPEEVVLKKYRQYVTVLQGHDEEWILQAYLNAFTQAYDIHSAYLSPRSTEDFDIAMKLKLTGIGAVLTYDEGAAKIVRLIAGGPAERDGRLRPGDKIIAVAQGKGKEPVDIMYWPLYKSVRLIRGEAGTPVVLDIIPAADVTGVAATRVDLIRDTINLEERAAKSEIRRIKATDSAAEAKLGVVTLHDFYADQQGIREGTADSKSSAQDVKRLIEELHAEDIDGILLDLRNNGGGSLQEAIEMTGYFIADGPIVQVKADRRVEILDDPDDGILYDGPLVVLVNRLSASASEILAGALQDYGRAVIVGDSKTHGKGSVQSVFPVDRLNRKLGSLKITTAGFYRIDGESTQIKGVKPDIVIPSEMDVMEIGEEYLPNVLSWSWVSPARYVPLHKDNAYLDALRLKSEQRRDDDARYASYNELLERLHQRINNNQVSLQLDKRLDQARQDRELEAFQKEIRSQFASREFQEAEDPDGEKTNATDLILDEALLILRDLVQVNERLPS